MPHQDRLHDYSSPARDNNKLDLDNINNNKLNIVEVELVVVALFVVPGRRTIVVESVLMWHLS